LPEQIRGGGKKGFKHIEFRRGERLSGKRRFLHSPKPTWGGRNKSYREKKRKKENVSKRGT